MRHYFRSGVVRSEGQRRGFDVIEDTDGEQKVFVTVWGNTYDPVYIEARRDADRIAEALNRMENERQGSDQST